MNNKMLLLIILFAIFSISGIIIAEDFTEGFKLNEGQNAVNLSFEFSPIYVADLIKAYPEITTITYSEGEISIGYVNVFGGIGENFVIYPNKIYEITTISEVELNLR